MKYARIYDNIAVEIITFDPKITFISDVASLYTEVPDTVDVGWCYAPDTNMWSAPAPVPAPEPDPTPEPSPLILEPMDFRMLFTPSEELAIKALVDKKKDDGTTVYPEIGVLWERLFSPQTKTINLSLVSVRQGIEAFVPLGILTPERLKEVMSGKMV